MSITVAVREETTTGRTTHELTLEFLSERVTARELIRRWVYQEVRDYNARQSEPASGLVQPSEAERALNGESKRRRQRVDWEAQYAKALKAFAGNGFLLLVEGQQLEHLEDEVELRTGAEICFLRLVPLIGG